MFLLPDSGVITSVFKTRDKGHLFYILVICLETALSPGLDSNMTFSFLVLTDDQPSLYEWELSGARD